MAIGRIIPRKGRQPTFTGRVMVDAVRGVLRVRKWPRKRGSPKSAKQAFWVDWFRQANRLAKYADGMSQVRAKQMTKGSGMYPRDVLLKAMRGRLYFWTTPDGWKWYSMAAIGDVSESLDVLGQTVGDILVRAVDRWRPPPAGLLGQVLTNQGVGAPPIWASGAGGGGITQQVLAGTPIVPDNSVAFYDVDVTSYAVLDITWDALGFAASTFPKLRFSTDGGSTFKAGASDYSGIWVNPTTSGVNLQARVTPAFGNSATNHYGKITITSLRVGRASYIFVGGISSSGAVSGGGEARFAGPITDIRIMSHSGSNMNAGTIRMTGTLAA